MNLAGASMYEPFRDIVSLKQVLERNTCCEHRMKPVIVVFNSTMIIKCCCSESGNKCRRQAEGFTEALRIKNLIIK
jgi:hypothetical protein